MTTFLAKIVILLGKSNKEDVKRMGCKLNFAYIVPPLRVGAEKQPSPPEVCLFYFLSTV